MKKAVQMKTEKILGNLWKRRTQLLVGYVVISFSVALHFTPPETPLNELIAPLNIVFIPVWAGLFVWYLKTGFRDLFKGEEEKD